MSDGSGVCSPTGQNPDMRGEDKNMIDCLEKWLVFQLVWNKAESPELNKEGFLLGFDKLCMFIFGLSRFPAYRLAAADICILLHWLLSETKCEIFSE